MARDDFADFVSDLENILTYLAWLEGELEDCCNELTDRLTTLDTDLKATIGNNENQLSEILEDLWSLEANADESFVDFTDRVREEFAETNYVPISSNLVAEDVPDACGDDSRAAREAYIATIADYDASLTYNGYAVERLNDACGGLSKDYIKIIGDNTSESGVPALTAALFTLRGNDGETQEAFVTRIYGEFVAERADPGVTEAVTGIVIPPTPAGCGQSTHDYRQNVVDFDSDL